MSDTKVALIPGASRPIGRAIARIFAQRGFTLCLPYYDWPESVAEMEAEFTEQGISFLAKKVDLRDKEHTKKLLEDVNAKWGHLDILINNIERGGMPIVHGTYEHPHNYDQWQREQDTTLGAKINLFQASLPLLQKSADPSLINISSIAAQTGRSGPAGLLFSDGYACANAGVHLLTRHWAREYAPMRVNEIALGIIDGRHGEGTRGWKELTKEQKDTLYDHILLGRTGLPNDVAKAVEFLAFYADYITGTTLTIDGGYLLGGDKVPTMPPGIL